MSKGSLQYVSDTQLIEKLFLIDLGLRKQAGIGDFLGGIASSVMNWAKQHVAQRGVVGFLADLLVPGILFKAHPLLGTLATIAELLGFSPSKIISGIIGDVKPKIESGEEVSADDINSIGKSLVSSEVGGMTAESSDMFDELRQLEKRGELVRFIRESNLITEAAPGKSLLDFSKELAGMHQAGGASFPIVPILPDMGAPLLQRIFGNLFQKRQTGKAKWLLGGFFIWFIKTALLGAGLLAGGEMIKNMLTKKKDPEQIAPDTTQQASHPVGQSYTFPNIKFTPTGNGQDIHPNDHASSTWIVPIQNGSVKNTLLAWAPYVYKDLQGKESLIQQTRSFNKTVNDMMEHFDDNTDQLTVPSQFKSIKQVVDQFAPEVASKLQGMQ